MLRIDDRVALEKADILTALRQSLSSGQQPQEVVMHTTQRPLFKTCSMCKQSKPFNDFDCMHRITRKGKPVIYSRPYCSSCRLLRKRHWDYGRGNNIRRYGLTLSEYVEATTKINHCYICGDIISLETAHADHVIPKTRGGLPTKKNLKWTCRQCNLMKHDYLMSEFLEKIKKILAYQDS